MPSGRVCATLAVIAVVVAAFAVTADAQGSMDRTVPKPSTVPNPYRLVSDWPTLPATMKGPRCLARRYSHRGSSPSLRLSADGCIRYVDSHQIYADL